MPKHLGTLLLSKVPGVQKMHVGRTAERKNSCVSVDHSLFFVRRYFAAARSSVCNRLICRPESQRASISLSKFSPCTLRVTS